MYAGPDARGPATPSNERRSPLQWWRDLPGPLPWFVLVVVVGLLGLIWQLLTSS